MPVSPQVNATGALTGLRFRNEDTPATAPVAMNDRRRTEVLRAGDYSDLSAVSGSIRAARRAGT